ncbi:hypothetical protein F511_20899 [Dorcoceras hygrometricum]|uniref:Uncharacterized protein n=1 Tax=Dorcoceras hygrometricum TaxID=472368 RepID=A0A2Z7ARE0_9LAMI|nr:hypothetical protein F511_20899 [Dorcoceras hygrometricum]
MSLFDLQDVCVAIGSIATLDLPMVVDLIGIYGLKGPYWTLTTTNWFLQALSVIPRGSWGDVSSRFTMIRWAGFVRDYSLQHFAFSPSILFIYPSTPNPLIPMGLGVTYTQGDKVKSDLSTELTSTRQLLLDELVIPKMGKIAAVEDTGKVTAAENAYGNENAYNFEMF